MYFRTSDDVTIYYEKHGEGFPLILLNGMWGDTSSWNRQIPEFSQHFTCIGMDHRGIGNSDKWVGEYTYDLHARDICELMQHLGIKKSLFAGVCHGGMVAVSLALAYPDKVCGLVLNGVSLLKSVRQQQFYDAWRRILNKTDFDELYRSMILPTIMSEQFLKENLSRIDEIVQATVQRTENASALGLISAAYNYGYEEEELRNISIPALFIAGEEDLFSPVYLIEKQKSLWKQSQIRILNHCGHFPQREATEEYNRVVLEYLLQRIECKQDLSF